MAALEPDDPGHVGRYRLLSRLGEGGMGRVYLGASPAGRAVAIKVVRPELADDHTFRARFRAEVEAARRVSGAFTSPVVDADPDGTVPWLATAYVNGLNLKDAVARHGPMPEPLLRTLGAGLGEALIAIQQNGLLHRDLKPANILLAKDGPRVIDFGISRAADGTRLTSEGQFMGTPGYMPPEQIRGEELTSAADVFAFGAVLAYAATGRPPFGLGPVHTVIHRTLHEPPDLDGVPRALSAMVAACLSRDPADRPRVALLPQLLAAQPLANGWLPDAIGRELDDREHTLVLDLKAISRARTRRRLLLGGAAVAGLAAVGGGTAMALAGTDDGEPGLPTPALRWKARLPTGGDFLSPLAFEHAVVVNAYLTKSTAYDTATGRELWSAKLDGTTDSALMYVPQSTALVALDPATRAQRWRAPLPVGYDLRGIRGPKDGTVIGVVDGTGTVIGYDARSGAQLWAHRAPPGTELQGVQGGSLIAKSGKGDDGKTFGTLFALATATGEPRWTRQYANSDMTMPGSGDVIFNNQSGSALDALSASTGRTLWTANIQDGEITVANGMAYVAGSTLHALDLATGQEKWSHVPAVPSTNYRTFLASGRFAYTLDNRTLLALDARTGRRLWSASTPGDDKAPLLALGGLVLTAVAGSTGPGLYGWDATTGRLVWSYRDVAVGDTEPWILTNVGPLLVALHGADLFAFRLSSRP
ncbi:PQQ-binding-like beta-propeller repeat protein [Actinomadura barringtoniae]|uniref:PQQ-binding-like beta-propeller repeat protein n=1 Tax=Actinomadura barringtoniae TaxID=1427535 RepID=A0A939PFY7_9ACTN|nr:serine/threonine-protein kinase [Actinomadura barringtoniae]MBO2451931.1 PQQ-binding-like beta-propeller repeat protein [Actinomadura barringtoniae]